MCGGGSWRDLNYFNIWFSCGTIGAARRRLFPLALFLELTWRTRGPFSAALWSLLFFFDALCRREGPSFLFFPQLCDRLLQSVGVLLTVGLPFSQLVPEVLWFFAHAAHHLSLTGIAGAAGELNDQSTEN